MYEDVCYKKTFLTQVIARVDLVGALTTFEKGLPLALAKTISDRFPINEPVEGIALQLQFRAGEESTPKPTPFKQWNFYGKDREKQLALTANFFFVVYQRYTTYEDLKADFLAVSGVLARAFPEAAVARFGLRYINNIEIEEVKNIRDWTRYVAAPLVGEINLPSPHELTRLVHIAELKYADINLRFQYGMPNPDYPAVMKRLAFVLDLDAYVQAAHELSVSSQYMEEAHNRIQRLFEESITTSLRERMNVRSTTPHT